MIRGALPTITTRQSFTEVLELFGEGGAPFNLTGATVQISIGRPDDWVPWYGSIGVSYYDCPAGTTPLLTLKTSDGTIPTTYESIGKYPFSFTATQIATLAPGQYVVAADLQRNGVRAQLLLGSMSIIDGVTPQ